MKYLILIMLVGCSRPYDLVEKENFSMEVCVISCIERKITNFHNEAYSTDSIFIEEFETLCRMKSKHFPYCYQDFGGYYMSVTKKTKESYK